MADDARFEDAPLSERPLRLKVESAEDLAVVSSLVQDAVGRSGEIVWMRRKRRLVLLMNRFRWENGTGSAGQPRPERVRSALTIEGVLAVRARGVDQTRRNAVYELLAILFEPGEGCAGRILLTLAGGGELAVEVECLDAALADLSRPWPSPAGRIPRHAG